MGLKQIFWRSDAKKFFPSNIKEVIRVLAYDSYEERGIWRKSNPWADTDLEWSYKGESAQVWGILYDRAHYHAYYMAACMDLKMSYEVIDITNADWLSKLEGSEIVGLLVWPHLNNPTIKEVTEERLKLLSGPLGIPVYPNPEGLFLLDNKRRVIDWLQANGFDVVPTWIFQDYKEVMSFISQAKFPLVFKSLRGSVSRGVKICKNFNEAKVLIDKVFGKGLRLYRMDPRFKQIDSILFQEYLPQVDEKRMIAIGDSYFSIDKIIKGDFHSGSGLMKWSEPDKWFLETTRQVASKGNFRSINVDFFIANDGRKLINELHPVFHGPKIPDSDLKGRWQYDQTTNDWLFQAGNFYRHYCTNLRVMDFADQLQYSIPDKESWLESEVFNTKIT